MRNPARTSHSRDDGSAASLGRCPADNRFEGLGPRYYTRVSPSPVPAPRLIDVSPDAGRLVGLDDADLHSDQFLRIASGNETWPRSEPLAMVYAGHQFGNYVGQLGDGRALLLAQLRAEDDHLWDLHLKGSGPTPYSRFADGRAVVRSSIREFLVSEAMASLGVPTTRALSVVASGQTIQRETPEPGALTLRIARSHIRFGHFEYFFYREEYDALPRLADHVIHEYFPELADSAAPYTAWLAEIIRRTAELIAGWQAMGFVHGVMNTDNMSAVGDTLDYGPFAFMEAFNPHFCPNHTDRGGRYDYENQAPVGEWNVSRLLQACLPLLSDQPEEAVAIGNDLLATYRPVYHAAWSRWINAKIGLEAGDGLDTYLADDLMERMRSGGADFTRTFRALAELPDQSGPADARFLDEFPDRDAAGDWLVRWRRKLTARGVTEQQRQAAMAAVNPVYVLRTHLVDRAIQLAEAGDGSEVRRLRECLRRPFARQAGNEHYERSNPNGTDTIVLSCSS